MALSPKERERIIEEETLRFETRQNLNKKCHACRPVRWPWVLLGLILIYGLWVHIFCRGDFCNVTSFKHCPYESAPWTPPADNSVAPGQPVQPQNK